MCLGNEWLQFHRLSNREHHYTRPWLLRDHLNNVVGYIIICSIHYWLVEWFCCYYRGITLQRMKPFIYWAGFGIMLCVVSEEETIICSAEILSPHKVFSFMTNKNWLFPPFLLNFPNDLVNKSLLRNEAASIATYRGICLALSAKQETKPGEIKEPAPAHNITSVDISH